MSPSDPQIKVGSSHLPLSVHFRFQFRLTLTSPLHNFFSKLSVKQTISSQQVWGFCLQLNTLQVNGIQFFVLTALIRCTLNSFHSDYFLLESRCSEAVDSEVHGLPTVKGTQWQEIFVFYIYNDFHCCGQKKQVEVKISGMNILKLGQLKPKLNCQYESNTGCSFLYLGEFF